jgi:hypothetical protein
MGDLFVSVAARCRHRKTRSWKIKFAVVCPVLDRFIVFYKCDFKVIEIGSIRPIDIRRVGIRRVGIR